MSITNNNSTTFPASIVGTVANQLTIPLTTITQGTTGGSSTGGLGNNNTNPFTNPANFVSQIPQVMGLVPMEECCGHPAIAPCISYPIVKTPTTCVQVTITTVGNPWGCAGTITFNNPNGPCPPWGNSLYLTWDANVSNMTPAALATQIVNEINGYGNQSYHATSSGGVITICSPNNKCNFNGATMNITGSGPSNVGELGGYVVFDNTSLTFGPGTPSSTVGFDFSIGGNTSTTTINGTDSYSTICTKLKNIVNNQAVYSATCVCNTQTVVLSQAITGNIQCIWNVLGGAQYAAASISVKCGVNTYTIPWFGVYSTNSDECETQQLHIVAYINSLTGPAFPFTAASLGLSWELVGTLGSTQNGCVVTVNYRVGTSSSHITGTYTQNFTMFGGSTTTATTGCTLTICAPVGTAYNGATCTPVQTGGNVLTFTPPVQTFTGGQAISNAISCSDCRQGYYGGDYFSSDLTFAIPVFANPANTSDLYSNDWNTWLFQYPTGLDAINSGDFKIQKWVNQAGQGFTWITQATITDNTYGIPYNNGLGSSPSKQWPFYSCSPGTTNITESESIIGTGKVTGCSTNFQGYSLSWLRVYQNFGAGLYRFYQSGSYSNAAGGGIIEQGTYCSASTPFCLAEWNCTNADKTVKFEAYYCGGTRGDVINQGNSWSLCCSSANEAGQMVSGAPLQWYDSIRFTGFFGNFVADYNRDSIKYADGTINKIRDEMIKTYDLRMEQAPDWLIERFGAYALMADQLYASDYNLNNPDYGIKRKWVVADSGIQPKYTNFSRFPKLWNVKFKEGRQYILADRCC
jgi:hypothetical protein